MRLAVLALLVSGSAQAQSWTLTEHADEFDDQTAYIAQTNSERPVENLVGTPQHAVLQLRCDKAGGPAYWRLIWPTLLTTTVSSGLLPVAESAMELRFDDGRVYGASSLVGGWLPDAPVGTTQSVSTWAVKGVLSRALKAQLLRVRDTTWDGKTLTASFSLVGLAESVTTLRERCSRL